MTGTALADRTRYRRRTTSGPQRPPDVAGALNALHWLATYALPELAADHYGHAALSSPDWQARGQPTPSSRYPWLAESAEQRAYRRACTRIDQTHRTADQAGAVHILADPDKCLRLQAFTLPALVCSRVLTWELDQADNIGINQAKLAEACDQAKAALAAVPVGYRRPPAQPKPTCATAGCGKKPRPGGAECNQHAKRRQRAQRKARRSA